MGGEGAGQGNISFWWHLVQATVNGPSMLLSIELGGPLDVMQVHCNYAVMGGEGDGKEGQITHSHH